LIIAGQDEWCYGAGVIKLVVIFDCIFDYEKNNPNTDYDVILHFL
jgi:hypothetical protein